MFRYGPKCKIASLIGDAARANILSALMVDTRSWQASWYAMRSGGSSGMGYVPLVPLTDRAIRRCVEGGGVGDDIRSAAYLCREFKKQTVCFVTFLGPR